jgi:hypothetical protein
MKKKLMIAMVLTFILFPLSAQKTKDVLYLKNGSIIYGKLLQIVDDNYKIQSADGSIFIFKSPEVEKFVRETPAYKGRRSDGFGFALEAGLLAGAQNSDYSAPFSFNFLTNFTIKTKSIISLGSGVEFLGKPFTPLFIEYKQLLFDRKTTPFVFARGGTLFHIGKDDPEASVSYDNIATNYKGSGIFAVGTGISFAKDENDAYLSFAYRYAQTSYDKREWSKGIVTYKNSFNRLEIKFGFRF